ncbi:hypothetical protein D3C86_1700300 [compost metagenome]
MSVGATAFWVPTSDVGNSAPEAMPVSSMNRPLSSVDCGSVKAMPRMNNGMHSAPVRICGLKRPVRDVRRPAK